MSEKQIDFVEKKSTIINEAVKIDPETVDRLRQVIKSDLLLQVRIERDVSEMEFMIQNSKEYSDENWGNQERIPLVSFLKNTNLVELNSQFNKKNFRANWIESVRWSNEEEKKFIETAKQIGNGSFVEVFQMSLFCKDKMIHKNAAVGSGLLVSGENIFDLLQDLEDIPDVPDTVFLVHNHFDNLAEMQVPIERFKK